MENPIVTLTTLHQKKFGVSPIFSVTTDFVNNKTNLPINTVTVVSFFKKIQPTLTETLTGEIGENQKLVKQRLAKMILEQIS